MLPEIVKLTKLDDYRDGGSLSASYESKENIKCTLFFKIKGRELSKDGVSIRICNSPVIHKSICNDYISLITGVTSPDWKKRYKLIGMRRENYKMIYSHIKIN